MKRGLSTTILSTLQVRSMRSASLVACCEFLSKMVEDVLPSSDDLDRWIYMASLLGDECERLCEKVWPVVRVGAGASNVGLIDETSAQLGANMVLTCVDGKLCLTVEESENGGANLVMSFKRRDPIPLQECSTLESAMVASMSDLPPGFLHVWEHVGRKIYVVGTLYDFWHTMKEEACAEVVVVGHAVSFFLIIPASRSDVDLEELLIKIKETWETDTESECDISRFKAAEEPDGKRRLQHHGMWFESLDDLRRFCGRFEGGRYCGREYEAVHAIVGWHSCEGSNSFQALQDSLIVPFPCPPFGVYPSVLGSLRSLARHVEHTLGRRGRHCVTKSTLSYDGTCIFEMAGGNTIAVDFKRCSFTVDATVSSFDPELLDAFSFVDPDEFVPGNVATLWMFPRGSQSSRVILQFCRAVLSGSKKAVVVPPEDLDVLYDSRERCYTIELGSCHSDGGGLCATLDSKSFFIRCRGGKECNKKGFRIQRPTRGGGEDWNLSFLLPRSLPPLQRGEQPDKDFKIREFLREPNLFLALGASVGATASVCKQRIEVMQSACEHRQATATKDECNVFGVHELSAEALRKVETIKGILLKPDMESIYRECIQIESSFAYPLTLVPSGPSRLMFAFFVHLAAKNGYKRSGQDFYIPVRQDRVVFYKTIPWDQLLTQICSFTDSPNLCALLWTARVNGDMERMLRDENHWPSVKPSKRYLGFRNVVYDLVDNVAIPWEQVCEDLSVIPFNYLEGVDFPVDYLERFKVMGCPDISKDEENHCIAFEEMNGCVETSTPLFDQALSDQGFDRDVTYWFKILFGRMFHCVGKSNGDNWEIAPMCIGAPGTFKSSVIAILQSFVQPNQFGVLATKIEERFPITALMGKLMVFMTETDGCDMDKELLKQMIAGDCVAVSVKFKSASMLPNWDIPAWFCGNGFFKCHDTDGSLERRCAVFPFTRLISKGNVDLVKDIIAKERIHLLIQSNTLYLAMRNVVKEVIHPLLPQLIRDATNQALQKHDSLRAYMAQNYVMEQRSKVSWNETVWPGYVSWCRNTGRKTYPADPYDVQVQTMVRKMGGQSYTHHGQPWLVHLRERTNMDPPYKSAFDVSVVGDESEEDDLGRLFG
jgi:hypothetical protein